MEDKENLLYKIWDKVNDVDLKAAVIQTKQEEHIKRQDELATDYYKLKAEHNKLKEEFTTVKAKLIVISSALSSIFGIIATNIYNYFKHN